MFGTRLQLACRLGFHIFSLTDYRVSKGEAGYVEVSNRQLNSLIAITVL